MTREQLTVVVGQALAGLGDTPDAIAVTLAARGITGDPHNCVTCPIAQFLATLPGVTSVSVGTSTAGVNAGNDHVEIYLPEAVTAFVGAFDAERFPQLIAPLVVTS